MVTRVLFSVKELQHKPTNTMSEKTTYEVYKNASEAQKREYDDAVSSLNYWKNEVEELEQKVKELEQEVKKLAEARIQLARASLVDSTATRRLLEDS